MATGSGPGGPGTRKTARRERRRYHHGNLRPALLDAALRLIRGGGPESLTLRAAARLAGVSPAAPYRHFADKEALLAAVAEDGFRAMTAAMRAAVGKAGTGALERFRAVGLAYVAFAVRHPSHFRVMFGGELRDRSAHPSLRDAASETFAMLVDGITACQRAGVVRDEDPEELALVSWSAVHGVATLLIGGQLGVFEGKSGEALAEIVARDLFLGLGRRG